MRRVKRPLADAPLVGPGGAVLAFGRIVDTAPVAGKKGKPKCDPCSAGTPAVRRFQDMPANTPMGRFLMPDEIAAMAAWLASDECSFSTGAVFDITGGRATY